MAISTLYSKIKPLAILLLWGIFSSAYFVRFPIPDAPFRIFIMATAGIVLLSAFGYGALLVRHIQDDLLHPGEFFVFSALIGFGVLALLMILMGAFSLWERLPVLILISFGLVPAWSERHKLVQVKNTLASWDSGFSIPLALIALGLFLSLVISFSPPTYYDTLVYHYALPQSYINAGRWVGQPTLIYSAFPQNLEMLWTIGIVLMGDMLANIFGWVIAALGLAVVYQAGTRLAGKSTGLWAAALLSVMPSYLLLTPGGYIDVGLTVFIFSSFYALCLWFETRQPMLLLLSGCLAGLATGTKYTGGLAIIIGAILLIKEGLSKDVKSSLKQAILYGSCSFITFLPWMVKNIYFVGNPVFPFFYSWTMKPSPWVREAGQGYFRALVEYEPRSITSLLTLVWDVAVKGLHFGGGMDVLGDLGWGALVCLLPLTWLSKKWPTMLRLGMHYLLLFFVAWGMSRPVLRFFLPAAPLLALGAAFGYTSVKNNTPHWFYRATQTLIAFLLLSNAATFFLVTDSLQLFRVPLGLESRSMHLTKRLKYYSAARFVNSLPENTLIYIVGDQCSYYYNRPVLVTPVFNNNPLTSWANEAVNSRDLLGRLRYSGVTHLLINHTEMERLDRAYRLFPFTERGRNNWITLQKQIGHPLFKDKDCEVFAL